MVVKTVMSKAYDRIEWDLIGMVLKRLRFHKKWISWIMHCITTVTYSFLLNGFAQGMVHRQRGIRQGDPLSPYLFILSSEVLSRLCTNAQLAGHLTGIRIAKKSPRISHLLFADDTMFFCRSDEGSCKELMSIIQKYETASSQMINKQKSAITFSTKTEPEIRSKAKEPLGIQKEGGLGKYLGLLELFRRKKKDLFNSIIDRIHQRTLRWSSKFLSTAGKTTMLKSLLAAMPTYTLSCFKLPISLCKRIQSALTRFWWDASVEKRERAGYPGLHLLYLKEMEDLASEKSKTSMMLSWRILSKLSGLLARTLKPTKLF